MSIACQADAASGFFKQRSAQLLLDLRDRIGQIGLTDMKLFRCFAVMFQLSQNFKIAQMIQIHEVTLLNSIKNVDEFHKYVPFVFIKRKPYTRSNDNSFEK